MISLYKLTRTALGTAKRVLLGQLRGVGVTGDDDHAESEDDVEIYHPLGFVSRPDAASSPEGLEALVFEDGGDQLGILGIVNKLLAVFSPAVEEGETRLYGAKNQNANVRLRANGAVNVNADAGQNVVFNGGTTSMVKDGDSVSKSAALGTWMSQVEGFINGAAPGTVTPLSATITSIGTVNGTATRMKA